MIDLKSLKPILTQAKLQKDNPALYQVIDSILNAFEELKKSISSIGQSSSSNGIIQSKTIILNNDLIINLPTAIVQLIPAPAIGSRIKVVGGSLITNFAIAYSGIDSGYADIGLYISGHYVCGYLANDNTTVPVLTRITDIFGTPTSTTTDLLPYSEGFASAGSAGYVLSLPIETAALDGAVLYLAANNGGSNYSGGDPSNTAKIIIYYIVEKL